MIRTFCAAILILALGMVGLACADTNNTSDMNDNFTSRGAKADTMKIETFSNNVFFSDNLIPANSFINQDIEFKDTELELTNMLLDPMTGSVLYIIVSQNGWFGINIEQHVIPFDVLRLNGKTRQLVIQGSGITLDKNTVYEPKREGRWGEEEVASYCKNTGLENIMQKTRETGGAQQQSGQNGTENQNYQVSENLECLIEISRLHNREVLGDDTESLGEIQSFLLDAAEGKVKFAVMDHGSLLGLSDGTYLIPWRAFQLDPLGRSVRLLVTEDNLDKFSKAENFDWDGSILPKDKAQEVYSLYQYDYEARQ